MCIEIGDKVAWEMNDGKTMAGKVSRSGLFNCSKYVTMVDGSQCGPIDNARLRPATYEDIASAVRFFATIGK